MRGLRWGLVLGALGAAAFSLQAQASSVGVLAYVLASNSLNGTVEVASLSGAGAHRLAPGIAASVAPSGSTVAVVVQVGPRDNASTNLVVYPSAGGSARKLYHCGGFLTVYGWAPDSSRILATCPTGLQQRGPLIVIPVAGGGVRTLASGVIEGAGFAPDGTRVVFALGKSQNLSAPVDLFTASAVTAGPADQLTSGGINVAPVWGPHGIVYAHQTSRGSQFAPINQIWIIQPDGHGARQLTHMSVDNLAEGLVPVSLSANGEHLLADFEGTDQSSSWAVDLGSAKVVPHPLTKTMNTGDAISRDGSRVLFTTGFEGSPSSVDSVAFGGGTPTVLERHGVGASWNQ